ncbi:hypothetical protein F4779DRAFT_628918 [Xylariaceae sp. FL0662B]|nr:hypothetical protein F4779DRAFT_628918 [Xylariaceae sp. FL0662B]
MWKVSILRRTLLVLVGYSAILQVLAVTCYHLDGSNAGPSNTLCNPNATGTTNSHSACCNSANADACLSTGLCLNSLSRQQSHMLWATGCTDSTFQDPSCPQYCHGGKFDNAHLKACNDSNFWCCESDANILTTEECCNNAFKLSQPIGTVIAQMQSGIGAIPLATSSPYTSNSSEISSGIPAGAIAGLAVEGAILLLTLAGLGFTLWRNRKLGKKMKEAEIAAAAAAATIAAHSNATATNHHQWQQSPVNSHAVPEMATYGYGSAIEGDPAKRNELDSPGFNARTELADTAVKGSELSSSPMSPNSPRSPFS